MKRKPKISIEEQLYRAGIWERPKSDYLYAPACYRKVPDAAQRLYVETVLRDKILSVYGFRLDRKGRLRCRKAGDMVSPWV